jgi:hypothetical protein
MYREYKRLTLDEVEKTLHDGFYTLLDDFKCEWGILERGTEVYAELYSDCIEFSWVEHADNGNNEDSDSNVVPVMRTVNYYFNDTERNELDSINARMRPMSREDNLLEKWEEREGEISSRKYATQNNIRVLCASFNLILMVISLVNFGLTQKGLLFFMSAVLIQSTLLMTALILFTNKYRKMSVVQKPYTSLIHCILANGISD